MHRTEAPQAEKRNLKTQNTPTTQSSSATSTRSSHRPIVGAPGSSLFDPLDTSAVPCHRDASDTERAAAERISNVAGKLRRQTLRWIVDAGTYGATGKELGARYALLTGRQANDGSARYSVMPRATELSQAGFIADSGQRRAGSRVWIATDAGREALANERQVSA